MRILAALCGMAVGSLCATAAGADYAPVVAGRPITFPQDHGSHPEFRTEWWYVTGWLSTERGENLGFQITFFRSKPEIDAHNPSAFSPQQILIAHCAISDPDHGRLWQDQRIRRAGFGLVQAAQGNTDVAIEDWSLQRVQDQFVAKIRAEDFSLDLAMSQTQPPLLNGHGGLSRKGPEEQSASYYYSLPQLRVTGAVARAGASSKVRGKAWFDHEWSSEYLDAQTTGWDWVGINFDDGGALMAFRMRGPQGMQRWAGGTYRAADGLTQVLEPGDVEFRAARHWVSPRTGISYPVQWTIRTGGHDFQLLPLMDDQENDTRLSTGAIYWEGAVRALTEDKLVGRGYLELTGYGEPLRLR
jgi:predicted secreted hydrolase